jgi:hypothetical protein
LAAWTPLVVPALGAAGLLLASLPVVLLPRVAPLWVLVLRVAPLAVVPRVAPLAVVPRVAPLEVVSRVAPLEVAPS